MWNLLPLALRIGLYKKNHLAITRPYNEAKGTGKSCSRHPHPYFYLQALSLSFYSLVLFFNYGGFRNRVTTWQYTLKKSVGFGKRAWRCTRVASGTLFHAHFRAMVKTANIHDFYSRLHLSEGSFKIGKFLVPGQSF